ncbi:NUDIX hydrolase [Agrobacterium sp. BA1120]|uniref:NUDIX hydrolase n=1 Tax=Agrobacterium sp. BA1120 TaxID=3228927 RepID=UPI00336AC8EF
MSAVHFHFIETEPSITTNAQPLSLPAEERSRIDNHWQKVNADGRFFNGKALAATQLKLDDAPAIQISTSDYAHYLYSNAYPTATPCRIVYCGAAIVTSDDHLVLGEMASSTSSPGRIQFVAGNVEIAEDGTINSRDCCEREVTEEVGAQFLHNATEFKPLCIKTGGNGDHVGIFYRLRLNMTAQQAKSAFADHLAALAARNEKPELPHIHLLPLTPDAVEAFCATHATQMVDYLTPLLTEHLPQIRSL